MWRFRDTRRTTRASGSVEIGGPFVAFRKENGQITAPELDQMWKNERIGQATEARRRAIVISAIR